MAATPGQQQARGDSGSSSSKDVRGPCQPLSTIPGSNLTCTAQVNCSLCNQQIWICCQPQGHVFMVLKSEGAVNSLTDLVPSLKLDQDNWPSSVIQVSLEQQKCASGTTHNVQTVLSADKQGSGIEDEEPTVPDVVVRVKEEETISSLGSYHSGKKDKRKKRKTRVKMSSKAKQGVGSAVDRKTASGITTRRMQATDLASLRKKASESAKHSRKRKATLFKSKSAAAGVLHNRYLQLKQESSIGGKKKRRPDIRHYRCDLCNQVLKGRHILMEHIKRHITPRRYACDICGMTFRRVFEAKDHKRKVHDGWRPFTCDVCSKTFVRKCNLDAHMNTHTGVKAFVCDWCGRGFCHDSNFKRHLLIHTGRKRFSCKFCGKSYIQKLTMLAHQRKHTGERPYCCEICGKGFMDSSALRKHQKVHERERNNGVTNTLLERNNICELCGKAYATQSSLYTHKKIVHERAYVSECDICGKHFGSKERLDQHFRTHTGEKPYSCNVCGKKFSSMSNRNRHEKTHTDMKAFECPVCGKTFAQKSYLNAHLKLHTGSGNTRLSSFSAGDGATTLPPMVEDPGRMMEQQQQHTFAIL